MDPKPLKILFVCTEDWFFHSHFLPLIKAAKRIEGSQIILATTTNGKHLDLQRLGVKIIPVAFDRASTGGLSAGRVTLQLLALVRRERCDLIHFIALKPVLLGGLVRLFSPSAAVIYHVTGLGTLAEGTSWGKVFLQSLIFRLPGLYVRLGRNALFVENPDDLQYLQRHGLPVKTQVEILGGAGLNPDDFPVQQIVVKEKIHLAFVGRMIATKGVDVLIEAMAICRANGVDVCLDLYGKPDFGNPKSYTQQEIDEWNDLPNVTCHGYASDIVGIWKNADICVVSTRTREGMPRAMLEAASCGRPLIVTDVPGCRHFVRNNVEGLVVPPEDPAALAKAIMQLANHKEQRLKMGEAARQRVLRGYTEQHVISTVADMYKKLLK